MVSYIFIKNALLAMLYAVCFQIMRSEVMRISHELQAQKDKIKENTEKIKVNKTLPYLVSNVIEVRLVFAFTLHT